MRMGRGWAAVGRGRGSSPAPKRERPRPLSRAGDREGAATAGGMRGAVHLQPGLPQGEVAAKTHAGQDPGRCPAPCPLAPSPERPCPSPQHPASSGPSRPNSLPVLPLPGVLAPPHCPSPAPANSWSPRPLPRSEASSGLGSGSALVGTCLIHCIPSCHSATPGAAAHTQALRPGSTKVRPLDLAFSLKALPPPGPDPRVCA